MSWFDVVQRRVAERPWRAGLYAFVALLLLTLLLLVSDYALRPQSFPVKSVSFEGDFREVDEQALASAVMDSVRGNFFLIDLEAIRQRAESVPWVHEASVRRRWPDGVHIRFTEQRLVARWGRDAWLNDRGRVVDLKGRPGPSGLPRLSGPAGLSERMLEHYRQLSATLAPAGVGIAQLTLSARHSWSIVLDNGLSLALGREEPEPKVARFARVYPRVLAAQAGKARRVDLRYANGFTVEWIDRANPARDAGVMATGFNEG
jgi:cell division protein FtsQ